MYKKVIFFLAVISLNQKIQASDMAEIKSYHSNTPAHSTIKKKNINNDNFESFLQDIGCDIFKGTDLKKYSKSSEESAPHYFVNPILSHPVEYDKEREMFRIIEPAVLDTQSDIFTVEDANTILKKKLQEILEGYANNLLNSHLTESQKIKSELIEFKIQDLIQEIDNKELPSKILTENYKKSKDANSPIKKNQKIKKTKEASDSQKTIETSLSINFMSLNN